MSLNSYQATAKKLLKNWINPDPKSMQIGIWGTARAGKTTYLTALYDMLLASDAWIVNPDKRGAEFIEAQLERREEGEFPLPNEPGDLEVFQYELTPKRKNSPVNLLQPNPPEIILNFIDAPGEYYEDLRGSGREILDYLSGCHGIVFLLDPFRVDSQGKSYRSLLRRLFQEFRDRNRSAQMQQYMAFCITKVDQESSLWNQEDPTVLARQVMGKDAVRDLQQNFCREERLAFYSVSSIGQYRDDRGKLQSALIDPTPKRQPATSSPADFTHSPNHQVPFGTSAKPQFPEKQRSSLRFRTDVECQPKNVLEPVEWLIYSIQAKPPILPNQKN